MAIRIQLDKRLPQTASQVQAIISDGVSEKSSPATRKLFEDFNYRVILITGIVPDEEFGILEDLKTHGLIARATPEQ